MLVALKLQVLGLLPGVRAVFRVAGEIDTGNLGRTVTDLVFMVTRQGRWLRPELSHLAVYAANLFSVQLELPG